MYSITIKHLSLCMYMYRCFDIFSILISFSHFLKKLLLYKISFFFLSNSMMNIVNMMNIKDHSLLIAAVELLQSIIMYKDMFISFFIFSVSLSSVTNINDKF